MSFRSDEFSHFPFNLSLEQNDRLNFHSKLFKLLLAKILLMNILNKTESGIFISCDFFVSNKSTFQYLFIFTVAGVKCCAMAQTVSLYFIKVFWDRELIRGSEYTIPLKGLLGGISSVALNL